jgi:regulatory protein
MDEFGRYYLKAIQFLSFRSRSIKEVRDNLIKSLSKRKLPPETFEEHKKIIEQVIERLGVQKFLNDTTFAMWWVEQRARNKPKSKMVLRMELKQKGISQDIITAVLSHEDLHAATDDFAQAKKLVEKKIGRYKELPKAEIYKKLGGFLGRRGFSWEVTKRSIDEILDNGV